MSKHHLAAMLLPVVALCWPCLCHGQQIDVRFSPNGGCTAAIVKAISQATTSIDVAAYELTEPNIAAALAAAKARGVNCRIVLDPIGESPRAHAATGISTAEIQCRTDRREKLQHNKYAVIDNATVITGSFNWTNDAEHRNAENVVVIHDAPTATAFARDFAIHWNHSQPFSMKPATGTKNDKPRANLHHH